MEIMKTYDTICCRRCGRQFGGRKDVFSMSLEVLSLSLSLSLSLIIGRGDRDP
jgi:hypothetical protein